ncbi:MAG: cortex morphogenetic protein CmpA [Firmicutes bacterium]|nr:cortex morphogenetic protein CmpA [Bacillota bacterium]
MLTVPSWLRNQLLRAFRERDKRSVVMLNRVYYKYRRSTEQADSQTS